MLLLTTNIHICYLYTFASLSLSLAPSLRFCSRAHFSCLFHSFFFFFFISYVYICPFAAITQYMGSGSGKKKKANRVSVCSVQAEAKQHRNPAQRKHSKKKYKTKNSKSSRFLFLVAVAKWRLHCFVHYYSNQLHRPAGRPTRLLACLPASRRTKCHGKANEFDNRVHIAAIKYCFRYRSSTFFLLHRPKAFARNKIQLNSTRFWMISIFCLSFFVFFGFFVSLISME